MKSRTIEIIDNHIEALEEELEWYQEKNREWQEKCEALEKQKLFEPYPTLMTFLGKPIDYWQTLHYYADINSVEKLINENAHLKQVAANHHNNWMTSQQENARLREQLRWRSMSELPPVNESFKDRKVSKYVMYKTWGAHIKMGYYDFEDNSWRDAVNGKDVMLVEMLKWMPIPEDGDA